MTNANTSTEVTIHHRFEIPYDQYQGISWSDFDVARTWAEQKAMELDQDGSADDWAKLLFEEDKLVLVVDEVIEGSVAEKLAKNYARPGDSSWADNR